MKNILMLTLLVTIISSSAFAQSISDIDKLYNNKKYTDAKSAIDRYLSVDKNATSAESWYYKAKIYNAVSYDPLLPKSEVYDLKSTAFEAFKKTQQLDANDVRLKLEGYKSYLDLYFGMYDLAAQQFNGKDFEGSFNAFKKAGEVKDYILSKNYTFTEAKLVPFDTALVLNTAVAATQAKITGESLKYYNQLADKNLSGPDYFQVYTFLLDSYAKSKDIQNFDRIITKARSLYPGDPYWDETEIAMIPKENGKTELYAKYDELLSKNPNNYGLAYNCAVEYYNSLYGQDVRPTDERAAKAKLTQILKMAIRNDKGIDASVMMANHLYNVAADYSAAASKIKGVKPEDLKKKDALKKQSMVYMDETISYAQSVLNFLSKQPTLKPIQQSNQKIMLDYLTDIYEVKSDKIKAQEIARVKEGLASWQYTKPSFTNNFDNDNVSNDPIRSSPSTNPIRSSSSNNPIRSSSSTESSRESITGVVKARKEGGVFIVPAKLNGLPLHFVFDSGASDVSISLTEATFMLKNGYLERADIVGSTKYQDATGMISVGTNIIIRELEIAGIKLKNVQASVVGSLQAPLLLGQSALSRFGKISFNNADSTLTLGN